MCPTLCHNAQGDAGKVPEALGTFSLPSGSTEELLPPGTAGLQRWCCSALPTWYFSRDTTSAVAALVFKTCNNLGLVK